jgi:GDPmannose 4,6-dehydratase
MVEADLQAFGLSSPNAKVGQVIKDNAMIRQELGILHF